MHRLASSFCRIRREKEESSRSYSEAATNGGLAGKLEELLFGK